MTSSRRAVLSILVLAALGAAGCSKPTSKSGQPLKELTIDEVQARIDKKDGKTFIYDNNSKDRYDEGHVPTARWVDFKNVKASDLPSDKSATLIFYCSSPL